MIRNLEGGGGGGVEVCIRKCNKYDQEHKGGVCTKEDNKHDQRHNRGCA
jgi:hypothetical protein